MTTTGTTTTSGTATAPPSRRLRRVASGGALMLFPALLIPQALVDPAEGGTGEVFHRAATESSGALTISGALLMISGILMVPAVSGVLHQARDRGAGLANLSGTLFVLGGFAHFGLGFMYFVALPLAGGDRAEMVAFIERLNESAGLAWVAIPLILCFGFGVLLLPWAAWRAGTVHLAVPAVVTVAVLAQMFVPATDISTTAVLLVLTGAYVLLGRRVLRMTDAEWDGVPRAEAHPEAAHA